MYESADRRHSSDESPCCINLVLIIEFERNGIFSVYLFHNALFKYFVKGPAFGLGVRAAQAAPRVAVFLETRLRQILEDTKLYRMIRKVTAKLHERIEGSK